MFFGQEREIDLSKAFGDKKHKKDHASGLIHILNQYQFTVEENTPLDQSVALDPELLGKVFENLLASYNEETKTTARKALGAFYTPREIVEYMVDESLLAYLKVKLADSSDAMDEKLRMLLGYGDEPLGFSDQEVDILISAIDHLKAIDPAVGSGAFPMGMLHKLVHVLGNLDPGNEKWKQKQLAKIEDIELREQAERAFRDNPADYGRKLYLIENCIYGVDIQPVAVQIAKMRFFISLIVDQKSTEDPENNYGILALPNLETKFIAANTLIGIEKPKVGDFAGSLFDNSEVKELENKLKEVRHRIFSARTPATKRKLRDEDQQFRDQMGKILEDSGWSNKSARQLASWDPYNQNVSSGFFDPEWMFGIHNGFDICIANPPYVILQAGNRDEVLNSYFRKFYKVATYKIDLYHLFIEQGINLLKNNGAISYIVPSNFTTNNYTVSLRRFLMTETTIEKLVFFDDSVFDATVHNLVFIAHKTKPLETNICFSQATIKDYRLAVKEKARTKQVDMMNNTYLLVMVASSDADAILKKMRQSEETFGSVASVNFGMQLRDRKEYIHDVVESPPDKSLLSKFHRECYTGKDIHRYHVEYADRYCYFNKIAKRGGCWDEELHNKKDKILIRQIGMFPEGGLDKRGFAVLNSAFMIIPQNTKYESAFLLGVLNSSAIRFYWLNKFIDNRKAFPKIKGEYVKLLPLPKIDLSKQAPIIQLVNKVLTAKALHPGADTVKLEQEIDNLIYDLYGFTHDEIRVVKEKITN